MSGSEEHHSSAKKQPSDGPHSKFCADAGHEKMQASHDYGKGNKRYPVKDSSLVSVHGDKDRRKEVPNKDGARASKPKSRDVVKPHEATEREKRTLARFEARREKRIPLPLFKTRTVSGANGEQRLDITINHPDEVTGFCLQSEAIHSNNFAYYEGVVKGLGNLAARDGVIDTGTLNYAFSMVAGIEPRDQLESMLAVQMAAVHLATMTSAKRLQAADTILHSDSAERTLNKLARTFAAQVEALKRYRSKGEQKVTVEHVTVNEGGQAIVGSISHGGAGGGGFRNGR